MQKRVMTNGSSVNENRHTRRARRTLAALFVGLTFIAFGVASMTAQNQLPESFNLRQHRWKNRLLITFAASVNDPEYVRQQRSLEEQHSGMAERDLIYVVVLENGASRAGESLLSSAAAESLRKNFDAQPGDFLSILVGKDGGVKMREKKAVSPAQLYPLIDAMPMRRDEMQHRRRGN
ncbi:MAG: DUF4174 domain-containing protein [Acidobacteriota bacterium]|nr:DUF4174 domain-containing protein [Acidobacteriota bacterium]